MKVNQYAGAVIRLSGIVQGVGFRPFVYRNARRLDLKGTVQNTDMGVLIAIDGERANIERFFTEIRDHPPVLAEIHKSSLLYCSPHGFQDFSIGSSSEKRSGFIPISPDIATCAECLEEIFDPGNRRYRYPFTNCTNCGPRFTIIRDIPYDRKNTTMDVFSMCTACRSEYERPADRRYHAQPNACPVCGPGLVLIMPKGRRIESDSVQEAVKLLLDGKILAIKGLGGYHLAVDPKNHTAVGSLRERKRRRGKPFALMARDIATVSKYCITDPMAEELLKSYERPIVLLERRQDAPRLSPEVAPDTHSYGIMLPYTPIHHLLLAEELEILVMTSANLSEEPLTFSDPDAFDRLAGIADAFLTHDREIERPCDDSVLLYVPFPPSGDVPEHETEALRAEVLSTGVRGISEPGIIVPIRRSRGYVPRSVYIGNYPHQVFAAGASEKNTFCVMKEGRAFLSHHIGNLDNEKSVDAYVRGVHDFMRMFRVTPDLAACDLHPDYESTRFSEKLAQKIGVPLLRVQHHHAHIASVLAEHRFEGRVIGVAFDGTGYGSDGTIWGGEFLLADSRDFERAGYFKPVPMPGGDKCILETDRMALAYLFSSYGSADALPSFQFIDEFDTRRRDFLLRIMESRDADPLLSQRCPITSSCGRLFDAVASLVGLCSRPAYDAQGAILLESAAGNFQTLSAPYSFTLSAEGVADFCTMFREIVEDLIHGVAVDEISRRFHSTILFSTVSMCMRLREKTGLNTVALSGGVFQNRILFRFLLQKLLQEGFCVLYHSRVPPNDGGVSFGQGMVALSNLRESESCV